MNTISHNALATPLSLIKVGNPILMPPKPESHKINFHDAVFTYSSDVSQTFDQYKTLEEFLGLQTYIDHSDTLLARCQTVMTDDGYEVTTNIDTGEILERYQHITVSDDIKMIIDADTGEVVSSTFKFFDESEWPVNELVDALMRKDNSLMSMILDRYGQLYNKIESSGISDEHKQMFMDRLNEMFKGAIKFLGFPEGVQAYVHPGSGATMEATNSFKDDFADSFINAFAQNRNMYQSVRMALDSLNGKWNVLLLYQSILPPK